MTADGVTFSARRAQHDRRTAAPPPCAAESSSEKLPCLALIICAEPAQRAKLQRAARPDDGRVEVEHSSGLPNRYGGMAREGPTPPRAASEMGTRWRCQAAESSVGFGEADGQRRARWAACTHGVRASAVMLHGMPAGGHAPGGRARSAGGAEDEPRAATQQRRR